MATSICLSRRNCAGRKRRKARGARARVNNGRDAALRRPAGAPALPHQSQSKARIEVAAIILSAAGETGDRPTDAPHPRKFLATIWATIDQPRGKRSRCKRQIMTALLVGDSQIAARDAPLAAVRQNSATASAKLRENMSEFVSQSAIDFGRMLKQQRG